MASGLLASRRVARNGLVSVSMEVAAGQFVLEFLSVAGISHAGL